MAKVVRVLYRGSGELPSGEYDGFHRTDGHWTLFHHTGWWLVPEADVMEIRMEGEKG